MPFECKKRVANFFKMSAPGGPLMIALPTPQQTSQRLAREAAREKEEKKRNLNKRASHAIIVLIVSGANSNL